MIKWHNIWRSYWLLIVLMLGSAGCSTGKYLGENDTLYRGYELEVSESKDLGSGVKSDLKSVIIPEPNRKFLGLVPLRLWSYKIAGDSVPEKGFKHWLKYKVGEEPVVFKTFMAERSQNNLLFTLKSKGYFDVKTSFELITENRKTKVRYNLETGNRYKIGQINLPDTLGGLNRTLHASFSQSLLSSGDNYDLDLLKEERKRISNYLNNRGYYAFIPDYIAYKLDSNRVKASVDLTLYLKASMPKKAANIYKIGRITILEDQGGKAYTGDTLRLGEMDYVSPNHFLKPKVLERNILLKVADKFNIDRHNATINKLVGLGVYKYITIDYKEDTASQTPVLNPEIQLASDIPGSVDLTLEAVSKSNDLSGPGLSVLYRDKNFQNRAQKLDIALKSSFETQLFSGQNSINSINLGLESSLEIPKLLVPFFDANEVLADKYRSSTRINLDNSFLRRERYFTMYSLDAGWAYNWQETAEKQHSFKVFSLDYTDIYRRSEAFDELYLSDPLVRQSYAEQFILSAQYTFTYNNQRKTEKRLSQYFKGHFETAGNLLDLFDGSSESGNTFLGVYYAQFLRSTLEARFYYDLKNYGSLAYRIFAGAGYAYNNSEVLPYSRQFFTGGANSLRGFRYHSIGPGSYRDTSINNVISNQAGDIKLETNLEYRFPISGIIKGAVFMEAGNVWLLHENENKPGGLINASNILDELAVSTGFGIRLDASIIILRLDLGMPLRNPSYSKGNRWLTTSNNLSSWSWYRDKLILNFALGYPF